MKNTTKSENLVPNDVQELPLLALHPFREYPYRLMDDSQLQDTADSISRYGVLVPAIARPDPEGGYELISGHRRHRACALAGLETMPVLVRNPDDDAAAILLVDSNLQRESLLPSERAFAYRMKLEAMKHQGFRSDLTSSQVGPKLTSAQQLAKDSPDSASQIKRYIRLTYLIRPLLDLVDSGRLPLNPAYELSFLPREQQTWVLDAMSQTQDIPSLAQAKRLKQCSQDGTLTTAQVHALLSEQKSPQAKNITLSAQLLDTYFPRSYSTLQRQKTILRLLEQWQRRRKLQQER